MSTNLTQVMNGMRFAITCFARPWKPVSGCCFYFRFAAEQFFNPHRQEVSMHLNAELKRLSKAVAVLALAGMAIPSLHAEGIKRTGIPGSNFPISLTVSVPANSQLVFVSGTLADVANPEAPKGSYEAYGDTKTQTTSILKKIEKLLAAEGLSLADVVKVNVFMVGDPKLDGKMDFSGLNAAYSEFFGSAAQANKPVRTALQVNALPMPGGLIEIEATAAKMIAPVAKSKK
jgi:enamine deaminase RidA (YjgF/YER057c/UK114 family)